MLLAIPDIFSADWCQSIITGMQNSTVETIYNARKSIFCDLKFQKFLGVIHPTPFTGGGITVVRRGRLFEPIIPPPAIYRSATEQCRLILSYKLGIVVFNLCV